jgi:hypothetical protein
MAIEVARMVGGVEVERQEIVSGKVTEFRRIKYYDTAAPFLSVLRLEEVSPGKVRCERQLFSPTGILLVNAKSEPMTQESVKNPVFEENGGVFEDPEQFHLTWKK